MTAALADLAIDRPAVVYRLFNSSGVLLYVGSAFDLWDRLRAHARESDWWPEVDLSRTFVEWYPTKKLAEVAEIVAIRLDQPLCNRRHAVPSYDWRDEAMPVSPHYVDRVPGVHRSQDRHRRDRPARIIRPDPPELWDQLGALVGNRRGEVICDLIARFLDDRPMPPLPSMDH